MIAKWILNAKKPFEESLNQVCQKCPLLSMAVMQIITAVGMIIAVSGIALAGGAIIWMFYKLTGAM